MTGVENNVVYWESYMDTQRLQSVNDIGATKIGDANRIAQIFGRLVFILLFLFITGWGGGGVGLGWKKRGISTLYIDINTKQHTVLDT